MATSVPSPTQIQAASRADLPVGIVLGYPRIGRRRELKKAVEAFWAGRTSADELEATARELRLDAPTLRASCGRLRVYVGTEQRRAWLGLVRRTVERGGVLDVEGVVRQRFESAEIARATASTALSTLSEIMARLTTYDAGGGLPPAATLLVEDRLVDLAGLTSAEAIVALARAELSEAPADAPAVVIAWARH